MMADVFKTIFNHDIEIRSGYREKLPPIYDLDERETIYDLSKPADKETDFGVFSDIFQYAFIRDWLNSWQNQPRAFKKHLDIGGATGLLAGLFKATESTQKAYCVDNHDYRNALDHDQVRRVLEKINDAYKILTSPQPDRKHPAVKFTEDHLKILIKMYPHDIWRNGNPNFSSAFWHIPPYNNTSVDEYIFGNYYEINEKFDLLTACSSMDHFSLQPFFEKAYDLLESGGDFYIWSANWYCPLTSTFVFPDFPFGCQRLLRSDVARYFDKYYPKEIRKALRAYDYWHCGDSGQVAIDYINIACKVGFQPLNDGRLVFPGGVPKKINEFEFSGDHGPDVLRDVLRDIHCFKPNVTMLDLISQSYFLAFRKI